MTSVAKSFLLVLLLHTDIIFSKQVSTSGVSPIIDVISSIQNQKFPLEKQCDLVIFEDVNSIAVPEDHARILIDKTHTAEKTKSFLHKNSGCVIVVAKSTDNLWTQKCIDLLEKVGRGILILWGKKLDCVSFNGKQRSIVHIDSETAEVSTLCRRKEDRKDVSFTFGMSNDSLTYITADLWSKQRGLQFRHLDLFRHCEHPLSRRKLRVSYNGGYPYIIPPINPRSEVGGMEPNFIRILAKKFNLRLTFQELGWAFSNSTKIKIARGGPLEDVIVGRSTFGIGLKAVSLTINSELDFSNSYLYQNEYVWATRNPIEIRSHHNLTKTFPYALWILLYFTLSFFSITFATISFVYGRLDKETRLLLTNRSGGNVPWVDLILLPLSRFLQFGPIPWFPRFSTGKLVVLLLSIFHLFMIFFYSCNLRAKLIAKTYEKPMETEQDVLDRKTNVYVMTAMMGVFKFYKITDVQNNIMVRVDETKGGWYDFTKYGNHLPDYAREDVINNGAVYVSGKSAIRYEYIFNKSHGFPNIQFTKDLAFKSYYSFTYQKFAPWKQDFDRVLGQLRDMGFVQKLLSEGIPIEATIRWSPKDDKDQLEKITLDHLLMAMVLIILGWSVCIFTFLLEMSAKWTMKKHGDMQGIVVAVN